MSVEESIVTNVQSLPSMANSYQYSLSPIGQSSSFDSLMARGHSGAAILMRKLPRNTTREALRSMLLFAKDLKDADFVPSNFHEDQGFLAAIARFESASAATEAQAMLDGKPNSTGEANMIVEIIGNPSSTSMTRRNTIDPAACQNSAQPTSPSSNPQVTRHQSSRFNGTFQSLDKISPPNPPTTEMSSSEGSSHLQTIFSPQSPVVNNLHERARISGKSVIDQEVVDDDTGQLLKDPVAYMKNDQSTSVPNLSRRSTNPQIPLSRFSSLSLDTNMTSPPLPTYSSPRSGVSHQTNPSSMSPNITNMGPNAGYQLANQHYHRHNYPPVNPADQHPPCNTLYVGNLPIDTSEDELKALFSKQRGYKRLCFRTKQNGPMCFVEFEDVSFATKALNELYGVQLHNSVKGGIRLSFSKNPLGVRAGQPGSLNPTTPLSPQGPMSNLTTLGPMTPGGFLTANGPPPGLSAPPGLNMTMSISSPVITSQMAPSHMSGAFVNDGMNIGSHSMNAFRAVPAGTGMGGPPSGPAISGMYLDYMMDR